MIRRVDVRLGELTSSRPFMFDKPVEEAVEWSFHKLLGPGEASGHHTPIKPESKKEL